MAHGEISILIVDDSIAICQALKAVLIDLGVGKVDFCHDGETGWHTVEKDPAAYDALFIDLHMEGMDGLELIRHLNNLRYRGGIVVMSALERRILEFTLEVISNYNLRILGSAEKPIDKDLIAFMVKRIDNFHPTVRRQDKVLKRRELYSAIKESRVISYYQPKISSADNRVMGLEALVRIEFPGRGTISPQSFLPVAEKFDLIEALTDATLNAALPEFARFCEQYSEPCTLSINISPMQLYNDMLPDTLIEYLNRYSIPRDKIIVEVTENHAIREEQQLKNLNRLRIHGFQLSLDDYGAGFTNLRQLKSMPFNEIKLDAQLINGIHADKVLKIIVESVRKVSSELSLKLIAEGVSNPNDLLELDKIGVDGYQGYLFCRPRPMSEFQRWLESWEYTHLANGLRGQSITKLKSS